MRRARRAPEHPVDVLVGEDRGDDDVRAASGSRGEQVEGRRRGCARRPRSRPALTSTLEPAGQPDAPPAPVSTGSPRNCSAAVRASARLSPGREDDRAAPFAPASPPTPARRGRRWRRGRTTASFSAAIASRVSPSTSVCSSETFVRTTTRRVEGRSSRRAGRRARPRRPRRRRRRAANCAGPRRSAPRTASPRPRPGPHARERALEVRLGVGRRAARASRPTCGER